MKRVIEYRYHSFILGCGCCSDSESYYDVYEDDKCVAYEQWITRIENEEQLRKELAHLELFEVSEDSVYF